jgi:cytochrome P450
MLPYARHGRHEFLLRTALEYGSVARLWRADRLLVAHPDGIKHVLLDNHHNYVKGKDARRLQFLIGNGLTATEGASWLRQRRVAQPAFHRQRLASLANVITDLTNAMTERWKSRAMRNQPFDVIPEMKILTQQIIVRLMFGSQLAVAEAESIGCAFATLLKYFHYRHESLFALPEHWPTPRNHQMRQAQQLLDLFVRRIIEERRNNATDGNDLLSMLLEARDEATGEGMSDQPIRDEVRTFFISGYDSTSNALAWVWYVLAQHPHVEDQLYEELGTVLGGRIPSFEDLPKLPYLRMVIEETLRLYSPAWATGRTAVAEDWIDGFYIPAGAKVIISPYVTHRLPFLWSDPETFEPERFTPERSAGRHRCAYFPFGFGPRSCIGNNLAMLEAQLIVATVAQEYRLRLKPGHRVQAHPTLLMEPRYGIQVIAHSRRV